MSTSLLYHAFGIIGYHYRSQSFQQGNVTFRIEQPRPHHRCSQCGSEHVCDQGGVERTFRTVPIGAKATFVQLKVPRLYCFDCQNTRQAKIAFADPKKHYTRSFERYALELSRHMTIQDVARHLQVSSSRTCKHAPSNDALASPLCTNSSRSPSTRSPSAKDTAI